MKQVDDIKYAMDYSVFDPFDLYVERLGRFKRDSSDIWWAGIRESKELTDLQCRLSEHLIQKGFLVDKRRYNPHITLGRKVVTGFTPRRIEPFGQTVSRIDLMKSERIDGILTYTSIYRRGK